MARKILLVHQNNGNFLHLHALLEASGYTVEVAHGDVARSQGEHPDFVLLPWSLYERGRLNLLFLEGIPVPAWIISRDRRILAQNRAAERDWQTKIGEYCFLAIRKGSALRGEYRKALKRGVILPGTRCYFCRADEALQEGQTIRCDIRWRKRFFDVFWVPLGEDLYLHYLHDITPYREMERRLRFLAFHDPLTEAYNRRFFFEALSREIARARRRKETFSLLFFDLDHFKAVNDRFGHATGDRVLREVAQAAQSAIRKMDFLVRLGGDEFVVLLPATSKDEARKVAERIQEAIRTVGEHLAFPLTASFGVVEYTQGETPDTLLSRVDTLAYRAKGLGRDRIENGEGA
ncbi:diguanylate cyclase domain-containing protein [Candidatus Caldatribacterium sp. SIUC1]|uniref:GGDEF domain-containing response regulator n=1 Tax=Candidatus Caldatribacterium sp. SIUC1 TaxID=3418365 RepID=UPI003F694B1C